MPQTFQALRCYQCRTFQVDIVKKLNKKWQCKVCGEKQSVKKVYATGSGADCRSVVQNLNMQRHATSDPQEQPSDHSSPTFVDQLNRSFDDRAFNQALPKPFQHWSSDDRPVERVTGNRWASFLPPQTDDAANVNPPPPTGPSSRFPLIEAPSTAPFTGNQPPLRPFLVAERLYPPHSSTACEPLRPSNIMNQPKPSTSGLMKRRSNNQNFHPYLKTKPDSFSNPSHAPGTEAQSISQLPPKPTAMKTAFAQRYLTPLNQPTQSISVKPYTKPVSIPFPSQPKTSTPDPSPSRSKPPSTKISPIEAASSTNPPSPATSTLEPLQPFNRWAKFLPKSDKN
jgi:hypothetical protein